METSTPASPSISRRDFTAASFAILVTPWMAHATTDYPNKPVKVLVTYATGGANDTAARLYADWLSQDLKGSFVVENKPGASGITGTTYAAKANPDGYTLLLGAGGTMTINPGLFNDLGYSPLDDFMPIGIVARSPLVLVINPSLPLRTVDELIAYAKSKPNGLTFASPGPGTPLHLAGELFTKQTGIQATHIPYRGSAPALTDLVAGRVDMMFDVLSSSIKFIQADRLRAIGVTSKQRDTFLPDTPTIDEQGVKDFDVTSWFGFFAPANSPPDIIYTLTESLARAANNDAIKSRLATMAMSPVIADPAALKQLVHTEQARWRDVIDAANIKVEP